MNILTKPTVRRSLGNLFSITCSCLEFPCWSNLRMLQIACRERALSALHQIPQQIRRHRQLGECKAAGSDLLDRTADAGSFRMGREPVLGGLLAGLAGCQHIRDQSPFGGCDLVEGAVDSETFEIVVRRHAACSGDDAVETEIG